MLHNQKVNIISMLPYIKKVAFESCRHTNYDIEDFTQEIVANVYEDVRDTYVSCQAVTLAVLQAKTKAINTFQSKQYSHSSKSRIPHDILVDEILLENITANSDIKIDIQNAIACLSPEQRLLIYRVYWQGMTLTDIAQQMNVSVENISIKLKKAIINMRRGMGVCD